MPRSSPSTSPTKADTRIVEVVELDRETQDPRLPASGNRPSRWAILLGIAVLGVLGLSLLPASDVVPNSLNDTLPDPAVATTLVGSQQPRVAFISDDTFPMFVVSGLKGFVSFTEPVLFDRRWWIIGNQPDPAAAAVVLASEDGRLWEASSEIAGEGGMSIRIDQLTSVDGTLIAVGTEGTMVGPTFYSALSGNLGLWRSGDGELWVPEAVDQGSPSIAFTGIRLVQSGSATVLQAQAHSTAPFNAATRMPPHVIGGLASGRFDLTTRGALLVATGPLGIEIAEAPMAQVSRAPVMRAFRSDSFAEWSPAEVPFNVKGDIVAAPSGGFIASTGRVAFTSAHGVNWKPNPRAYEALYYQQWGDQLIGYPSLGTGSETIDFIDDDGTLSIQLPREMIHCAFKGSNNLLAGACGTPSVTVRPVEWNGFELSLSDLTWLDLVDTSTPEIRRFRLYRAPGNYDEETDTISLADSRGLREAFPVDVLRQLRTDSTIVRYDTMLSEDGLTWSRSQIALRGAELELLGGIGDGYLVATRSSEPGSTLTVLAADF